MAIEQEERRCKVTSPLGENKLILTSLDAWERVSGLFQFDCRFVSEDEKIEFGDIMGQKVTLEVEMAEGEKRFFNGRVARFSQSDADETNIVYHAQIVPWLWFLTRRTDCRIFQDETVVDILKKVFDGHKDIADWKPEVKGTDKDYPKIPYCVQYRETDFNFASRLMEEYGISYYFEHTEDAHTLTLFDPKSKVLSCPGQAKASYTSAAADDKTAGQVLEWHVQQEFRSGAYALNDFNYRDPNLKLGVEKKTKNAVGGNDAFEIYDYPGEYRALGEGDIRAQLRMEAEECAANAIHGAGTCYGFTPGYQFDLVGHYRDSYNDSFLITEVHHVLAQSLGTGGSGSSEYENSFTCVPTSVPFRPLQKTPKPIIQGVQTAIVRGEGGKEIDLDDLGCVYVQFHWDRNCKGDASSSCPIRVAQSWAGKEWGAYFAPRIGHEVIVEFIEGDPDRPIVTGRVYNGENKPPYGSGEQMGIKSRSTPDGAASNFNELKMVDSKGSELFYVQAEKDLQTYVKNDDTLTVGNNKSDSITANKSESVGGDSSEQVSGLKSETISLGKAETVGIAKALTIGAAYQVSVGAAMNQTVVGAKTEEVGGFRMEAVGGTSTEKVLGKKKISASGGMSLSTKKVLSIEGDNKGSLRTKKKLEIAADDQLYIDATKSIVIESEQDITLRAGKAEIVLKKDGGVVEIKGTKIKEEGKSEVKIKGGKVAIN